MRTLSATDRLKPSTRAELSIFREREQREAVRGWDDMVFLRGVAARVLAERMRGQPIQRLHKAVRATDLYRLGRLELTRRAVAEGVLSPHAQAVGRNKVLDQGIARLLAHFKDGTAYRLTHVDMGTSTTAPAGAQTGTLAHVDASAGVARVAITDSVISGKAWRTSSFITTAEYNGSTIAEACLVDGLTGGTPYNRVLFGTPVAKVDTDTAVANIDHELTN